LVNSPFINVNSQYDVRSLFNDSVSDEVRQTIIDYYQSEHGIDYTNPVPKVVSNPTARDVMFSLDPNSDLSVSPSSRRVRINGIIVDSLGTRRFNDYVIAKPPSGNGTSKDFQGIDVNFLNSVPTSGRQKEFTIEEFIEEYGAYQQNDGQWVTPTVHWITERLTGEQHPFVIDIALNGFDEAFLQSQRLNTYPEPNINNPGFSWGFDLETGSALSSDPAAGEFIDVYGAIRKR